MSSSISPLPSHTAFYRAALVELPPNDAKGALGDMPGKILDTPGADRIIAPAQLATSGTVTFQFNKLTGGEQGDVMVEVIPTLDAELDTGSFIGGYTDPAVTMHDASVTASVAGLHTMAAFQGAHSSSSGATQTPVADASAIPDLGIIKIVPQSVPTGDEFDVIIAVYNNSEFGELSDLEVNFTVPLGTQFVRANYGQGGFGNGGSAPGSQLSFTMATNNGPQTFDPNDSDFHYFLYAHTGAVVTITLKATGAAGTSIVDDSANISESFVGKVSPSPATSTAITSGSTSSSATLIAVTGAVPHYMSSNGILTIMLDGTNALTYGPADLIIPGSAAVLSQSVAGKSLLVAGPASGIGISGLSGFNNIASLIINGGADAIAAKKLSVLVPSGAQIVAGGGGNIIAAGGGNVVNTNGSNIVSGGGGNVVNTNGSNIIAGGGGNVVAAGGGNIVAGGGGNIIAGGGGNIVGGGGGSTHHCGRRGQCRLLHSRLRRWHLHRQWHHHRRRRWQYCRWRRRELEHSRGPYFKAV